MAIVPQTTAKSPISTKPKKKKRPPQKRESIQETLRTIAEPVSRPPVPVKTVNTQELLEQYNGLSREIVETLEKAHEGLEQRLAETNERLQKDIHLSKKARADPEKQSVATITYNLRRASLLKAKKAILEELQNY